MITLQSRLFNQLEINDKFIAKHDLDAIKNLQYIEILFKTNDTTYIGTGILYSDSRKNMKNKLPLIKGNMYEYAQVYSIGCE